MNTVRKIKSVIALALPFALAASYASAASTSKRIYGVEIEFDNPEIANANYSDEPGGPAMYEASDENVKWRDKWAKLMEKRCKTRRDCVVTEVWGEFSWDGYWTEAVYEYEVKYKNGFAFTISIDPAVLEVKVGPFTPAQYRKYQSLIDSEIYATAAELKLEVPADATCHVTFGAETAFGGDVRKFRNYLVLSANHPEADLVMNTSVENAPPLSYLPETSKRNFVEIISEVDAGEIEDERELARAMLDRVQNRTYYQPFVNEWDPPQKYQSQNLQNMAKKKAHKRRAEKRAMPPARSGRDVVALVELSDADLEYATTRRGNVRVDIPPKKLPKEEVLERFDRWVKQRGLDPKDYAVFYEESYAKVAGKTAKFCKKQFAKATKAKAGPLPKRKVTN
jgi:hypothetical protein